MSRCEAWRAPQEAQAKSNVKPRNTKHQRQTHTTEKDGDKDKNQGHGNSLGFFRLMAKVQRK